jgi:protein TonB
MNKQNRLAIFLIYSVAAHIGFFAFLLVTSMIQKNAEKNDQTLEITVVDPDDLKVQPENIASTIVETDSKTANEQIDKNAKFLSEKNNTVEKETRAQSGRKFVNAQAIAKPQQASKGNKGTAKTGAEKKPDLFKNDFDAYNTMKQVAAGEMHAQDGSTPAEASSTNDNLQNVENEFMTRLNTREYKYYGYYTRIKNQLNQWWVPQVQQKFTKMMRQGRTIASENSKVTKLVIVLNGQGNLVKVQVLAASGVRDLDDAAIEAFRQAAPFPNPPKGMIERDGTVKIRWDCVVES